MSLRGQLRTAGRLLVLVGGLQAWASAAIAQSAATPLAPDLRALGESIYQGRTPMSGRIRGHDSALPTAATRCVNCHLTGGASRPAASSVAATQTFGPALDAAWLTRPRVRSGGPPVTYDAQRLCTLLRDGIDPALVMMPRTMPLYDATPAQCQALWTYLTSHRP
jgi:hypothetical protein